MTDRTRELNRTTELYAKQHELFPCGQRSVLETDPADPRRVPDAA